MNADEARLKGYDEKEINRYRLESIIDLRRFKLKKNITFIGFLLIAIWAAGQASTVEVAVLLVTLFWGYVCLVAMTFIRFVAGRPFIS
nr:hypothetical protein [uncultured Methanolobus sp.]